MDNNPLFKNALPNIPRVKLVDGINKVIAEGYYWAIPETSYCFAQDYERDGYKIVEGIVTYDPGDWGLPNTPRFIKVTPPHKLVPFSSTAGDMLARIHQCRERMIPHKRDVEILNFIEHGRQRNEQ